MKACANCPLLKILGRLTDLSLLGVELWPVLTALRKHNVALGKFS